MSEGHIPVFLTTYFSKRFPGCYAQIDALRTKKVWPSISDVAAILAEQYGLEISAAAHYAPEILACAVWNVHKRVYAFDDSLAQSLTAASESSLKNLPIAALEHLPLPCVYIQAPDRLAEGIDGFFAWISDSVLYMVFLFSNSRDCILGSLQIDSGKPFRECLQEDDSLLYTDIVAAMHGDVAAARLFSGKIDVRMPFPNVIHNLVLRGVQLLLYLGAIGSEIEQRTDSVCVVGKNIGSKLRQSGETVRHSHVRQGHWHNYWIGPKNGERKLVPKWVEPVIVGSDRELSVYLKIENIEEKDTPPV